MSRQQHIDDLEQARVSVTRDLGKMTRDSRTARGDLAGTARRAASALRDDAKGAVRQMAGDARQVAAEAGSDTSSMARERLVHGAQAAAQAADPRRLARRQPVAGFALGVGLGLAVAYLFGTRGAALS